METKVQKLVKDGAAELTSEKANSNIFLVKKKNGKEGHEGYRLVNDMRSYNKAITDYEFKNKTVKEVGAQLGKKKIFSTADPHDAYHTVRINPINGDFPIAHCPGLPYNMKYKVLPQGLKVASGHYLASVEAMFPRTEYESFLHNYMDDSLISSEDEDEHLEHWRKVLEGYNIIIIVF